MAIKYVGATEQQIDQLDQTRKVIRKRMNEKREKIPAALFKQLAAILNDKKLVIELEVKDDARLFITDPSKPGNWGYWGSGGGRYIEINSRCFSPWSKGREEKPPRLTAVLLHEMVHIAGGNELDAESFENILFSEKDGAALPSRDDEKEFRACKYEGVYVSMDPKTRDVSFCGEITKALARRTRIGRLRKG